VEKIDETITAVPQWDKSAKQVWDERFATLTENDRMTDDEKTVIAKTISLRSRITYIASIAAAVLILISATAFLYTKNVNAVFGQTLITHFPDGSLAELSSGSTVSYKPYLWLVSPNVKMTGEVYFSGKHTKDFTVKTDMGSITVLGTSFNASTYHNKLQVACVEGKVSVSNDLSSVLLTANMQTTIENKKMSTVRVSDMEDVTGWTRGIFSFNNKPLKEVLADIERYYDVSVAVPQGIDTLRYTGRFTRDKSPQEVLGIIAHTYGITLKLIR
jgi:transmembrane sensor